MGQAWDKELSADHSHFIVRCSEFREIRTILINRPYLESKWMFRPETSHFTDALKKAMCIVAYLQDQATLKQISVIKKSCLAFIRHMKT